MFQDLKAFYKSSQWQEEREYLYHKRLNENGELICWHCGKPIYEKYDAILHHWKVELTIQNVNDFSISLNEDNLEWVHFQCHNEIHSRFGANQRNVFIVHGSICSGKTSWVAKQMTKNDIKIDMDDIWQMISCNERYIKPNTLKQNVFSIYNKMIEDVSMRLGNWTNCYIITTMPRVMDRKRLVDRVGGKLIHVDTDKETCLKRLYEDESRKYVANEYAGYIEEYFKNFQSDDLIST